MIRETLPATTVPEFLQPRLELSRRTGKHDMRSIHIFFFFLDVGILCEQLPALKALNLSYNLMAPYKSELPLLKSIRVLVLNNTGVDWEQVELLRQSLTTIEELHIMGNNISRLLILDWVIALFRVDFTGKGELVERQVSEVRGIISNCAGHKNCSLGWPRSILVLAQSIEKGSKF